MFDTASPLGLEASGGLVENQPKTQIRAPGNIVFVYLLQFSFACLLIFQNDLCDTAVGENIVVVIWR